MTNLQEFMDMTDRCSEQCESMIQFEQEKRQALLSMETKRLEQIMQDQQAAMMRLESLEKRRLECQQQAGLGVLSAQEILSAMEDGEEKRKLSSCFDRLRKAADELKLCNAKALEIAKENLQLMETMEATPKRKDGPVTYSPGQTGAGWQGGASFEIKI